jgi:hypothetical protein
MYMYLLKGKTRGVGLTLTERTKTIMTHPQLTGLILGIGVSAAIGVLLMMLTASPEQALAWRPVNGRPMID